MFADMPPKRNQTVAQAKCGRPKTVEVDHDPLSSDMVTPVRKKECKEIEHPSVVTAATFMSRTTTSSMSPPSFRSPESSLGRKLNFKDMIELDRNDDEDKKFVKAFEGWDDYQELVNAIKHIFPAMKSSAICAMSYDQLIDYLFVFRDLEEQKSVFFVFAVNKRG